MKLTRRNLIGAAAAGALASPQAARAAMPPNHFEGKDTPKICLITGDGGGGTSQEATAQRIKQLGVQHVIGSAGGSECSPTGWPGTWFSSKVTLHRTWA